MSQNITSLDVIYTEKLTMDFWSKRAKQITALINT